ncbi:YceD family protein [Methylovirgula sp. 4M-Z18]|uniref:YceD family protein n=1 Tax=Methylovirgula sp. 4M-Z18 TaxID=2293567 RepID=UPI000E2F94F7|nr:DUF177 domain-containing protein [Methylovirgula sp. 4M-Z18]RFB80296.1 DUF177 domain-containing protein [Methylovirgula sp. 4M-Z18]
MKQSSESVQEPAFTRPVHVDEIRDSGLNLKIDADEAERAAVAVSLGLEGLAAFSADLRLSRLGKNGLRLQGDLHADVTYISVVSLEPFDTQISEPLDARFAPQDDVETARKAAEAKLKSAIDYHEGALEDDPPEPIVNGRIDLGPLLVEFLALALDPYPRKPGEVFTGGADASPEDESEISPFAALLKPQSGKE